MSIITNCSPSLYVYCIVRFSTSAVWSFSPARNVFSFVLFVR